MRGLAIVLLLAACAEESRDVIEIGVIDSELFQLQAPATVHVCEPALIRFNTAGDDCVVRERTEIALGSERVDITPYDRSVYQETCVDTLYPIAHEASFMFASAGVKTIVVHGLEFSPRAHYNDDVPENVAVSVTITVE